ncbi:adenosylcobalamin-dependent ribonucleoside-diphosphate reductase [Candidatus Woesearchaeota archaeon]|nr:adenosylcobalamin-dependent ribonucleoside-diphosphate reductase [Candidatus Woesearchaeota archaeon]
MVKLVKIRKRDGTYAFFNADKIKSGIEKAIKESKANIKKTLPKSKKITQEITKFLEKNFSDVIIPTSQDIEDIVLETLKKYKLQDVIESFLAYKKKQLEAIPFKTVRSVRDDVGLSENSLQVLAKRYLLKNESGTIVETPRRLFERVARAIAEPERLYSKGNVKKTYELFLELLLNLEFLPNTPTLMNAETKLSQLSACFVLPVEDSLKSIFKTLENTALIHQSGGGTGFNFSKIRPKGDIVMSTKGVASGPISFMKIYNLTTDIIKQGGKRRGANMGMLEITHPDIEEFITVKSKNNQLNNFNISVLATEAFMESVEKNEKIALINPRTKKKVKEVSAKQLFDLITENAWKTGDPGLVFIDEINRHNPTPKVGKIECTNPCGEQPLLPYESCNLGSINLIKMFVKNKFSWEKLRKTIRLAVHFLDNVIDANKYPSPEIEAITKANRKIGLGVMGFAETLARLEIPYNNNKAIEFAEKLMKFIQSEARKRSEELGIERGSFPNFPESTLAKNYNTMRNSTVTTIAPTGTISIIANATSGIEPFFAISFVREVMEGTQLVETNEYFEQIAKEKEFYSKKLMLEISRQGSIQKIKGVPKSVKDIFVTAFDINPEWHVRMQAAFQKYTDNAVSKTINLSQNATVEDVKKAYTLAHKLKCKGITVFRYGSKEQQVLYFAKDKVEVKTEFAGGCPGLECVV